ncbi:MAG: type II toxin-antitoxin system ParD family antitoxin [gamma proteobacterium symbiont of Taylorina sp.]|nr:type II toxin-antitoxin system ParD family antitoxin [gamma proteobacterium symbiont of Taylorina sp.]
MPRNTSITLGEHFSGFIEGKILQGRFESTSEAVRSALRLLEERETKFDLLRNKLSIGEAQLDQGEGVEGDEFMQELAESPLHGKKREELKIGYYSEFIDSHTIYYRINSAHIDIIDVLHQSMEPSKYII